MVGRKRIYESGKVIIICKEMDGNIQPTNKKCNLLSQELYYSDVDKMVATDNSSINNKINLLALEIYLKCLN